jgi:hypothetical protein
MSSKISQAKLILVHDLDENDNRIISYILCKNQSELNIELKERMNRFERRNVVIAVYDVTERTMFDVDHKWKETKTSYKK